MGITHTNNVSFVSLFVTKNIFHISISFFLRDKWKIISKLQKTEVINYRKIASNKIKERKRYKNCAKKEINLAEKFDFTFVKEFAVAEKCNFSMYFACVCFCIEMYCI